MNYSITSKVFYETVTPILFPQGMMANLSDTKYYTIPWYYYGKPVLDLSDLNLIAGDLLLIKYEDKTGVDIVMVLEVIVNVLDGENTMCTVVCKQYDQQYRSLFFKKVEL